MKIYIVYHGIQWEPAVDSVWSTKENADARMMFLEWKHDPKTWDTGVEEYELDCIK